jgi:hypothetical protein
MKIPKVMAATFAGSMSFNAFATEPQSIDLAGFDFTPTLFVSESHDDNIRGRKHDEESSWITSINPTFLLGAETSKSAYQLKYELDDQNYHSDSQVSHTDHHLTLKSVLEFTARNRLRWDAGYHKVEETSDDADIDENDKYTLKNVGVGYTYGAQTAQNQLDFGANYLERRYHNSGALNDDQEYDSTALVGTWYHRLGARTRVLGELRHATFDYLQHNSDRDSTDTAALAGATWNATAKTSGAARFGAERKNFDSSGVKDYTSPMWEVGVAYKPRTYSTFSLDARRAFDEGDDGATTVHDTTSTLAWKHEWTSRIATDLNYRYSDRKYEAVERTDKRSSYGVGVTYAMSRWLDIGLGYRHLKNDSSLDTEGYVRNIYMVSFDVSL